jgi:hypothetical protein
LRVEPLSQALEIGGLIAHVHADRNDVFRDEARNSFIRIHLGIQPSASASHRSGAEVEEQGTMLLASVVERRIRISAPLNGHGWPSGS